MLHRNPHNYSPGMLSQTREHSAFSIALGNLPYAVMILLGVSITAEGLKSFSWGPIAALAYLAYGVLGSLWIILFLCPYCLIYGERSCPCGYGILSAKLRPKGDTRLFSRKFRRHIPAIVPLWIIPPLVGGIFLASHSFSWPLAILVAVFVIHSFLVLPLVSKSHGCKRCPQRADCPWMKR